MKTIKITLLSSLLLVVLALSFAFVPNPLESSDKSLMISKKVVADKKIATFQWWVFTHPISEFTRAINPSNYRRLHHWENESTLCQGNQRLCAIFADSDPSNPNVPIIPAGPFTYQALYDYFNYGLVYPPLIKLKN